MKATALNLLIDPGEKPYETILDEAIAQQEKEWLSIAVDPKKKRKGLSAIEKRYPLPDAYQVDFTEFYSGKSRKNAYAYVWTIHDNQFQIIKSILQKLTADGLLAMTEYDFDVEADGFELTKLTQGKLLIQDSLYSFDLTFVSKTVGTIKTQIIVAETEGLGDFSISTIDLDKIQTLRRVGDDQSEQKGSVKDEYKHRNKKNKA